MAVGHNILVEGNPAAYDDGGDEVVFHYAQWHIGDYIAGTMGMTLETEGAYQRFLMRLYQRGKPLPDDDRFMATTMSLSLRVWKRLKEALIELGKIVVRSGCLTNSRFEQERRKRAEDIQKRATAARVRWENSRKVASKLAPSLTEVSPKLPENISKKLNEINDSVVQMDMLTINQNPITNNQEKKTTDTVPVSVGVSLDEIDGLNGATMIMRTKIAKWVNPYQPDYRTAQGWMTSSVQIYGSDALKEAFAIMETKMASGDVVGAPLKLFAKIAQEKKRELDERKQKLSDAAGLKNVSEAARKKILADQERARSGEDMLWD